MLPRLTGLPWTPSTESQESQPREESQQGGDHPVRDPGARTDAPDRFEQHRGRTPSDPAGRTAVLNPVRTGPARNPYKRRLARTNATSRFQRGEPESKSPMREYTGRCRRDSEVFAMPLEPLMSSVYTANAPIAERHGESATDDAEGAATSTQRIPAGWTCTPLANGKGYSHDVKSTCHGCLTRGQARGSSMVLDAWPMRAMAWLGVNVGADDDRQHDANAWHIGVCER